MNVAAILKLKGGKTVVTTTADKSMLDVAKLLTQHSIGCIVIERDDGEVAGIVSERDLMRAIGHSGAKVLKEPVSVYMTKTVVTAQEAAVIILSAHIKLAPGNIWARPGDDLEIIGDKGGYASSESANKALKDALAPIPNSP
jgi:CBS domain-containing protein